MATAPSPFWFEPTAGCAPRGADIVAPVRATDAIAPALAQQNPSAARRMRPDACPEVTPGPVFFSPRMHAVVWIRDATAKDSVLQGLPSLPGLTWTSSTGTTRVEVRQARYDATIVDDWMNYLMARGLFRHGDTAVGMGTDEHIEIGVVGRSDLQQVVALLEVEHVPCPLVTLQVTGALVL